MRSLLPPDGGPITVSSGRFLSRSEDRPAVLVMIEIHGGPMLTVEPNVWADLVRRIRAAPSARSLGA